MRSITRLDNLAHPGDKAVGRPCVEKTRTLSSTVRRSLLFFTHDTLPDLVEKAPLHRAF